MNLDWSNVGVYSRGYGFAVDHNLEFMIDHNFIRAVILELLKMRVELTELILEISKKEE